MDCKRNSWNIQNRISTSCQFDQKTILEFEFEIQIMNYACLLCTCLLLTFDVINNHFAVISKRGTIITGFRDQKVNPLDNTHYASLGIM